MGYAWVMTTTQTTARAFGKCMRSGCRHKIVTTLPVIGERLCIRTEDGRVFAASCTGHAEHNRALHSLGLTCPTHGAELQFRRVRGTYNPDKVCDSRCTHAKTAPCDCSCGGENHGAHSAF